jgi:hypothetical protein
VLCSSQDHLRTGTRDLDHSVLTGAKNTNSASMRCRFASPGGSGGVETDGMGGDGDVVHYM